MLNKALQVVGTAEYDPFGYPNRQAVNSQVLSGKPNQSLLFGVCEDPGASATGVQRRVRARFSFFDVAKSKVSADGVFLKAGSTVLDSETGSNRGLVVTPWVNPGSLPLGVYYYLDNDGITGDGVALESCEFRRYEAGVTYPVWTPIRFPGQYHDEETDLFENWNRYYDPAIGGYLQPEPLMQNPKAVRAYVKAGIRMNPYSYAGNNPVANYDKDGRKVIIGSSCLIRNFRYDSYLNNLSSSVSSARRASCVGVQTLARLQTVLNSEEDNVWVECTDESGRRSDGGLRYGFAAGPYVMIFREGWASNMAAPVLVHELTHAALGTSNEVPCYTAQSCTTQDGLMIP